MSANEVEVRFCSILLLDKIFNSSAIPESKITEFLIYFDHPVSIRRDLLLTISFCFSDIYMEEITVDQGNAYILLTFSLRLLRSSLFVLS